MNKVELIAAIAEKSNVTKKDAEVILNATLNSIVESLKGGDKVQLSGFGSFEAKTRAARTGINPKTGAAVKIPESKAPVFKAGKAFKETIQ